MLTKERKEKKNRSTCDPEFREPSPIKRRKANTIGPDNQRQVRHILAEG